MSILFARWWIVVSALLIGGGWILSAFHALNRTGYSIVLALIAAVSIPLWSGASWRVPRWRRFRRWLPLSFAIIGLLVALGGLLHAPNNYDALAYRMPRTLHWLAEGRWHWIETGFERVNVRCQGSEWTMAPLLLFTRTDRAVWLLNFLPFLALPGLIYSVLSRAGVSPRVAWHWMWLLPCGYGIAGQAGGSANDMPAAFFALAAVDFALRARASGNLRDLWISALAAAVLTAIKLSNAPLLLAWLAAAWPAWRLIGQRPFATASVALLCLLSSFLPCVILNMKYCGDWTGATAELPEARLPRAPGFVFAVNALNLAVVNAAPPIFPWSRSWNDWSEKVLPDRFLENVHRIYGPSYSPTALTEMQGEYGAGLGLGVSALLAASALFGGRRRRGLPSEHRWLWFAPWLALGVMLWMLPVTTLPRMALPYYPLLALALLVGQRPLLCATTWWRLLAAFAVASAAVLLVLTSSRPLLPMIRLLSARQHQHPSPLVERALRVYETHDQRADALAPVRDRLPEGVRRFGLVTNNDLETSLWRPFGTRVFQHVIPGTDRAALSRRGLDHLVINTKIAEFVLHQPVETWLDELQAEQIAAIEIQPYAARVTADRWIVVRLRP